MDEHNSYWNIEIINPPDKKGFKYALFDFDGTISLLREGWRDIMIPYFVEVLSAVDTSSDITMGTSSDISEITEMGVDIVDKSQTITGIGVITDKVVDIDKITEMVANFVDTLTGKQTIFQCIRLDEEVQLRGGPATDPLEYKKEYLRRLMAQIESRHESIKNKTAQPSDYLVPGCVEFLSLLKNKGVKLYLASGTDETDVIAEADLLEVSGFFNGCIYGARDEVTDCSKELVIRQILEDNNISGEELISFGDGYVEVQLVKDIDGYAVAVATNEKERKGINLHKRERLLKAKADAVIPDFSEPETLLDFIMSI